MLEHKSIEPTKEEQNNFDANTPKIALKIKMKNIKCQSIDNRIPFESTTPDRKSVV